MGRLIYLITAIMFLMLSLTGNPYCYAAGSAREVDWDYMTSRGNERNLDTVSLHILEKISETNNRSVYRGITVSRAWGNIFFEQQTLDSPAVGIGPVYMIRNQKHLSEKVTAAFDISGGFIVYDRSFPAGGRWYNFMWRAGPQFIYKISEKSSVNAGYKLMHVSNGLRSHNPGYDAYGVTFGYVTNF